MTRKIESLEKLLREQGFEDVRVYWRADDVAHGNYTFRAQGVPETVLGDNFHDALYDVLQRAPQPEVQ